jgi:hypothetical protein
MLMGLFRMATICFSLALLAVMVSSSAADEFLVTIQKIENGTITFVKRDTEARSRGIGRGRGAAKGGARTVTLPVAADVQVTTATYTRRTGEFHVGTPVGGGLKNSAVRKLQPGAMARVVTEGKHVIELNIVFDDEDGNTVVAVPPKPAPKK